MPLDATVGGASANSFLTNADAAAILATRLFTAAWDDAEPLDQDKALMMATSWITSVTCWTGSPATATQALPWPRLGMADRNSVAIPANVIPLALKQATAVLANMLLGGTDVTADNDAAVQGVKSVKAGPVEVEFKDDMDPAHDLPAAPYQHRTVLPGPVSSLLVPSWLCPAPSLRFFEVLG